MFLAFTKKHIPAFVCSVVILSQYQKQPHLTASGMSVFMQDFSQVQNCKNTCKGHRNMNRASHMRIHVGPSSCRIFHM